MRRAAIVLMVLNVLVWGGLAGLGLWGLWRIGSPNRGQVIYYLVYPSAVLLLALLVPLWPLWVREESLAVGALVTTLGFVPFYLFFHGGWM